MLKTLVIHNRQYKASKLKNTKQPLSQTRRPYRGLILVSAEQAHPTHIHPTIRPHPNTLSTWSLVLISSYHSAISIQIGPTLLHPTYSSQSEPSNVVIHPFIFFRLSSPEVKQAIITAYCELQHPTKQITTPFLLPCLPENTTTAATFSPLSWEPYKFTDAHRLSRRFVEIYRKDDLLIGPNTVLHHQTTKTCKTNY